MNESGKLRNIPTCVGKTSFETLGNLRLGKHPHLRGENAMAELDPEGMMETSPPAWGKLPLRPIDNLRDRNIPTCVGKTTSRPWSRPLRRKHPHLRGENRRWSRYAVSVLETSPPAWGKRAGRACADQRHGNIPTCVGKTESANRWLFMLQKHPHLRGENSSTSYWSKPLMETSPPAWGKRLKSSCSR